MDHKQLLEFANTYKTPLYVYDATVIRQRFRELIGYFHKKTKLFYAMKANYNVHILKILKEEGVNIDAVSPAEVILALKVGFLPQQILYTANMMTDEEMHEVQGNNILFNIGSLSELTRYGKLYPNNDVCLRFNPEIVSGHHEKVRTGGKDTKFGIAMNNLSEALAITKKYNLKIVGVHEHLGSGIPETVDMVSGMKNLIKIVTPCNFPDLKFVDFGGGFKIPYEDEPRKDYANFGKEVNIIFKQCSDLFKKELEMYFEPGRYLVAESGYFLIKVTTLKSNQEKNIVGTNAGFPQLIRPMFYGSYHRIENISGEENMEQENTDTGTENTDTGTENTEQEYDIAGNICETGDYFAMNRKMCEINEGDILAICDAGAYCYSMGGTYNLRPMPPEVVIDQEKNYVTKRLTNQELVDTIVNNL